MAFESGSAARTGDVTHGKPRPSPMKALEGMEQKRGWWEQKERREQRVSAGEADKRRAAALKLGAFSEANGGGEGAEQKRIEVVSIRNRYGPAAAGAFGGPRRTEI